MKPHGLSLLELMLVIFVVVTLAGLSVPSFTELAQRAEAASAAQAIFRSVAMARSQAVTRGQAVTLCGSDNGTSCSKTWSNSLLVFIDRNDNDVNDAGELVWEQGINLKRGHVRTRISWGRNYTEVNPDGSITLQGSMIYCQPGLPELARRITWNRGGRPYMGIDDDGDGIVEDHDGSPLSC